MKIVENFEGNVEAKALSNEIHSFMNAANEICESLFFNGKKLTAIKKTFLTY